MSDTCVPVHQLVKSRPYLVGIDSDGCAFDTMEIKHKECFIPNIISHWGLQPVSKYAREAAEFVNLYSHWRGINRFPALLMTFDLLRERPEVIRRGAVIPTADSLREWCGRETKLANNTLKAEAEATGDPVLHQALRWSQAVNDAVAQMVHGVPPFPGVRESLERLMEHAQCIVCSATPGEALQREWEEHDIARYVDAICGQEVGSKAEHLRMAMGDRWDADHVLMIGDALGDYKAACANQALFFPINPGHEEESWQQFLEEGCDRFLNGTFAGDYQQKLLDTFKQYLPDTPPWR